MNSFSAISIERPPTSPLLFLDRHAHVGDREVVGAQFRRIDRDLVLLHEAADRGDFSHAFDRGELIFQIPILHRTQFGEAALFRIERIHERPADAGRVRAERLGVTPCGNVAPKATEVFEHAAPRPVRIGAVLENHIDERKSVERIAANHLGARHRQHLGRDRIGDLVLDDLRRLPGHSV